MSIDHTIEQLKVTLDPRARGEFSELEQLTLRQSMQRCGLDRLPSPVGDLTGERAAGVCECPVCGNPYAVHPMDWRVIGYGDVPFLNILCDGRRVKL